MGTMGLPIDDTLVAAEYYSGSNIMYNCVFLKQS